MEKYVLNFMKSCHHLCCQERIATSFSVGSIAEAMQWLTEWISFCCKVSIHCLCKYRCLPSVLYYCLSQHRLLKKVRWLVNRLVMGCRGIASSPLDFNAHRPPLTAWAWLDTSFHDVQGIAKMDILRNIVLPAISRCESSQSLLIEFTDVLDSIALQQTSF